MRHEKKVRKLIPELERQGFRIRETKSGWMIYPPNKDQLTIGTHRTPSDHKAWKNFMADLKRQGFIEPQ